MKSYNSKPVSDILLFTISCDVLVGGQFKTIEYKRTDTLLVHLSFAHTSKIYSD